MRECVFIVICYFLKYFLKFCVMYIYYFGFVEGYVLLDYIYFIDIEMI